MENINNAGQAPVQEVRPENTDADTNTDTGFDGELRPRTLAEAQAVKELLEKMRRGGQAAFKSSGVQKVEEKIGIPLASLAVAEGISTQAMRDIRQRHFPNEVVAMAFAEIFPEATISQVGRQEIYQPQEGDTEYQRVTALFEVRYRLKSGEWALEYYEVHVTRPAGKGWDPSRYLRYEVQKQALESHGHSFEGVLTPEETARRIEEAGIRTEDQLKVETLTETLATERAETAAIVKRRDELQAALNTSKTESEGLQKRLCALQKEAAENKKELKRVKEECQAYIQQAKANMERPSSEAPGGRMTQEQKGPRNRAEAQNVQAGSPQGGMPAWNETKQEAVRQKPAMPASNGDTAASGPEPERAGSEKQKTDAPGESDTIIVFTLDDEMADEIPGTEYSPVPEKKTDAEPETATDDERETASSPAAQPAAGKWTEDVDDNAAFVPSDLNRLALLKGNLKNVRGRATATETFTGPEEAEAVTVTTRAGSRKKTLTVGKIMQALSQPETTRNRSVRELGKKLLDGDPETVKDPEFARAAAALRYVQKLKGNQNA